MYLINENEINEEDKENEPDIVSPGGSKYWKPSCNNECKPYLNQSFSSLEEGIAFYKEYGRKSGFDVIRHTEKKAADGTILLKYVTCKRAGELKIYDADDMNGDSKKKRRTCSSKCGCKAKIVLKYAGIHGYFVLKFLEEHNHPLDDEYYRQFMRVSRVLGLSHKKLIFDAVSANVGLSSSFHLMKEMCGGYSNVGSQMKDFYNFTRDVKLLIGSRDAQIIIEKLKNRKEYSDGFFYEFDVDEEGRLTKIFWADTVARRNYEAFGDIISFDATFRTNKYNMVFVPFTGIDNHKKSVTYGAGLLSKETTEYYLWIFQAFMRCMKREPICIVTDQCPSMKQAIPIAFKNTRHRLCMWHIMKKFPIKVGIGKNFYNDFIRKVNKLIWNEESEPHEFEEGWNSVLMQFNLNDNSWLKELYEIRSSWVPAYFRDMHMSGLMRTTSVSESQNNFFNHFHCKGDTLTEFYIRFESAMEKQRHVNLKLNYESFNSTPKMETPLDIEKDAASIYTRAIFYEVQEEIKAACFDLKIHAMSHDNGNVKYLILDKKSVDKLYEVIHTKSNNNIHCSCKLFLRRGILCRHGFFALKQCDVVKIPRNLVLNRWMKVSEIMNPFDYNKMVPSCDSTDISNVKLHDIWYEFQGCVSLAGTNNEKLCIVKDHLKMLKTALNGHNDEGSCSLNDLMESFIGCKTPTEINVNIPSQCRNKGSGKRLVSEFEKAINDRKQRTPRLCKSCGKVGFHDKRTCPLRTKVA